MHVPTLKTLTKQTQDCLGCRDCKGVCRAVIELAILPETVLHRSVTPA